MSTANKLRKPAYGSATTHPRDTTGPRDPTNPQFSSNATIDTVTTRSMPMQPLTATEQYWAVRALKAEALLAAQETHRKEVKMLGHTQEMKRERELSLLAKEHKEKNAALERLLTFLLALIALLVVLVIYLATHYTRHSMLLHHKQQTAWWSAIGASHFTIPILSPFTSVVEQESSVIGAKTIGTLAIIAACLMYMVFRHWIAHKANGISGTRSAESPFTIQRAIDR